MKAGTPLVVALLALGVAQSSEAQRLAPLAPVQVQSVDAEPVMLIERTDAPLALRAAARDSLAEPRPLSRIGAMIGGIGGGVVGAFVGMALGAESAQGCRGDMCSLGQAAVGLALGESLGLAVGAHVGSRSTEHGNMVLSTLTSTAIMVGGTLIGVGMQQAGVVMIPLTPAMQLAAAWAIESH